MTGKKLQRVLACLLAVLLLSQVGAFSPAVFAADSSGYTLHDGTAVIPAGTSAGDVNRILAAALVEGFDQMTAEEQDAMVNKGFEYQCHFMKGSAPSLKSYWGSVAGGTTKKEGLGKLSVEYTCPALADNKDGDYKVRLAGTTAEVTLTKAEKLSSSITLKEGVSVKLPYNEDGTLNADALRAAIFAQVVENTTPELMVSNVTIEYYATAESGSLGSTGKEWMPLEGGTKDWLTYPAIGEGTQEVRITWGGSKDYAAWQWKGNVAVTGRADAPFRLKEGVTEGMTVAMVYNRDQSINYEATAQALRDALLESTDPNISIDDVTVQYNTGIKNYQPLNYSPTGSDIIDQLVKFGLGSQTIHFAWNGNADYKPLKLDDVKVNMEDHRIASAVVLKSGASITYNMDVNVMRRRSLKTSSTGTPPRCPKRAR